jgi:hypothetical protein
MMMKDVEELRGQIRLLWCALLIAAVALGWTIWKLNQSSDYYRPPINVHHFNW